MKSWIELSQFAIMCEILFSFKIPLKFINTFSSFVHMVQILLLSQDRRVKIWTIRTNEGKEFINFNVILKELFTKTSHLNFIVDINKILLHWSPITVELNPKRRSRSWEIYKYIEKIALKFCSNFLYWSAFSCNIQCLAFAFHVNT
jgi:hypothetical protein